MRIGMHVTIAGVDARSSRRFDHATQHDLESGGVPRFRGRRCSLGGRASRFLLGAADLAARKNYGDESSWWALRDDRRRPWPENHARAWPLRPSTCATINGQFVGHGPARGPHGYYRVDEWDLTGKLSRARNVVALEVAGYNVNSYDLLDQPAFLQAEVVAGDKVLASTAGTGQPFAASILDYRVQKVQRYSFQRPFIEVYRLRPECDRWREDPTAPFAAVDAEILPAKRLAPRRVLLPDFERSAPVRHVAEGVLERLSKAANVWKDRSLVNIGPQLKGYPENQLDLVISTQMQQYASRQAAAPNRPWSDADAVVLRADQYHILDFGANRTGFLVPRSHALANPGCGWPSTRSFPAATWTSNGWAA